MGLRLSCCNHYLLRFLFRCHPAELVHGETLDRSRVPLPVTFAAKADEVRHVQADLRVVDVVRCEFLDVMHFLGWSIHATRQTILTKPCVTFHSVVSYSLPCFGFVEPTGEVFHVLVSLFVW